MQSSRTLIKISVLIPEVKSEWIKDFVNIFAYCKKPEQDEVLAGKLGLFQIQLRDLGDSTISTKKIVT